MRQEAPQTLDYEAPRAKRGRPPMAAGFIGGWLIGVPIGGVWIASLLGGIGVVVPMICVGTAVAGLPAFGMLWLVSRSGLVGNLVAFVVAAIGSISVSYGLLRAYVFSFHGC